MTVFRHRFWLTALASLACAMSGALPVHADWATCRSKPTRACVLEEAFSSNGRPLAGKERLDVLIQASVLLHIEYATAADIAEAQQLSQSAQNANVTSYALIAIKGLVAANQKQQALDLVGTFGGSTQLIGIAELARSLVKADDLDTALALADRLQPPPDPKNIYGTRSVIAIEAVKELADVGKIEKARALMMEQRFITESQLADMQVALGRAYAKRGDTKSAKEFYDQAEKNLRTALDKLRVRGGEIPLRFSIIKVMALRGDGEPVKQALQQMQAETADAQFELQRLVGYTQVIVPLLETKQFLLALDIAKSLTPVTDKDMMLASIASWQATNGWPDDARTTLSLLTDPAETPPQQTALRSLAAATARAGDVAGALQIVGQIHAPKIRAAALFLVAQAMPK